MVFRVRQARTTAILQYHRTCRRRRRVSCCSHWQVAALWMNLLHYTNQGFRRSGILDSRPGKCHRWFWAVRWFTSECAEYLLRYIKLDMITGGQRASHSAWQAEASEKRSSNVNQQSSESHRCVDLSFVLYRSLWLTCMQTVHLWIEQT